MDILRSKYEDLIAREKDIRKDLNKAEKQRKKPNEEVLVWLKSVDRVKEKVNEIEKSVKVKSSRCFSNCYSSPKKSEFVIEVMKEVEQLQETGRFSDGITVSDEQVVEQSPYKSQSLAAPTLVGESVQKTLDKIWDNLMDGKGGILGLYGIGGVGKTTTMMNTYNRLTQTKVFDKIIWVTLSKDLVLKRVQKDISIQLNLYLPTYEDEKRRASRLLDSLKKVKKFLIIFDDMWEQIPLEEVGIPKPSEENGHKIVLTTRSVEVCEQMNTTETIKVIVLSEREAWDLFVSRAGNKVLTPEIQPIARQVVRKCDDLPLLVISLGNAMRNELNIHMWKKALTDLTYSQTMTQGMEEKNFTILKFGYSRLKSDAVRNCFLYCALFPEDNLFEPEELIRYWIAENFINEYGDMVKQIDEGFNILRQLKDAGMLEMITKRGDEWLKMHDLFRDVAISIMRDKPEIFFVKAGLGLKEPPYDWEWDTMKVSLMRNNFKSLDVIEFQSPNIYTLLLRENPLSHISPSFFIPMPNLQLLDLSYSGIKELPSSLSELAKLRVLFLQHCKSLKDIPPLEKLKKLQVLNLRGTFIKELPQGMEGLVSLRSLDLSETTRLENIQDGVISSLSSLEELHLQGSRLCKMDSPTVANCIKEMRCLKRLAILTLSIVGFEDHLDTIMCLQEQNLKIFTINIYGSIGDFI